MRWQEQILKAIQQRRLEPQASTADWKTEVLAQITKRRAQAPITPSGDLQQYFANIQNTIASRRNQRS